MADVRLVSPTLNGDGAVRIKLSNEATWVATLSNGETAVEKTGDWTVNPGEPLPWVRLCHFLADSGLHVTSLRVNFRGRTIHMPRANFSRFGLEARKPRSYSLAYKVEAEMDLDGGPVDQKLFVELAAHYDDFAVHFVQDLEDGNNSWVIITDDVRGLAETPRI